MSTSALIKVDDYRRVAPPGVVDIILRLAERVRGRRMLHLSGGRFGGGAAEMLRTLVPVMNDLGLDAAWEITGGDPGFYATTQALRAALEGDERVLADEALAHYVEMSRVNAKKLRLEADLVLVHDVQPAPLVTERTAGGRWVWRCHFDCSRPQRRAWSFFRAIASQYDAAVFSLPKFTQRLTVPNYVIHPSIDPLSEKNRELAPREVATLLHSLRVSQDRPLLVQIGPFTRAADPLGVVNAYRLVKKHYGVRVVLAGTAGDDRESLEVLADLRQAAQHDENIVVLELPPDAHLQINALQRAATIVLVKSVREGFGLGAAEAMWKGKPVIGGFAGGLPQQILYDVTGYTVHSVEGAAFRIRHLLNNPELIARMGAAGREHVRRSFLTTRHLTDYMALLIHLTGS
ncbi:MAG: glycosyltransferase [Candidatus Rokuibacteriota bacterium]